MGWFTGVVLFVLTWWTVLFAVLPFVARLNPDPDPVSGVRGAHTGPLMWRMLIATTAVTIVIWLLCDGLLSSSLLSFRHGTLAMHGRCAKDVRFCS